MNEETLIDDSNQTENIDEAQSLKNELSELKEKKKQKIEKESIKGKTKNKIINGYVDKINNKDKEVELKVTLFDEEEKTENFTLNKPEEPEDYNLDNELLKFIAYFTDSSTTDITDVHKILHQKIKIKKEDNKYNIHMPENLTRRSKLNYKINNYLMSKNLMNNRLKFENYTKSGYSVSVGLLSVFLINNIRTYADNLFVDLIFHSVMSGVITAFLLYVISSIAVKKEEKKIKLFAIMLFIGLLSMVVLPELGVFGFGIVNLEKDILSLSTFFGLGFATIGITYVIDNYLKSDISISGILKSNFKKVKRFINKKKGIEYMD